ncbi:hypothetical protein [Streptomyces sp. NPDC001774]
MAHAEARTDCHPPHTWADGNGARAHEDRPGATVHHRNQHRWRHPLQPTKTLLRVSILASAAWAVMAVVVNAFEIKVIAFGVDDEYQQQSPQEGDP